MARVLLTPFGELFNEVGGFQAITPFGYILNETALTGPHALVQSGTIGIDGDLNFSGDIHFTAYRWSIPTSAVPGTPVYVLLFTGTRAAGDFAIVIQGEAVADDDSQVSVLSTSTTGLGGKLFAFVHDFADDLTTPGSYIMGGPCIATKVLS